MRKISQEELENILDKHLKWLKGEEDGIRADLSDADLCYMDLRFTNLCSAILCGADLRYANLRDANLSFANLRFANLCSATVSFANLCHANLYHANLCDTNLYYTDLCYANLSCANLDATNSHLANLSYANLSCVKNVPFIPYLCPEVGSFIGYKKANGYIVELKILPDARRCSATTRKCRCDKAKVLSIQNLDGSVADIQSIASGYDKNFIYTVGEIVEEPNFDEDRWNECSKGIHFFINRQEAVEY